MSNHKISNTTAIDQLLAEAILQHNRGNHEASALYKYDSPECKKLYPTVTVEELPFLEKAFWPISFDGHSIQTTELTQAVLVGATGSGKTTTIIENVIDVLSRLKEKPSFFVNDLKTELLQTTGTHLVNMGYTVFKIDAERPYRSVKYNPLLLIYERHMRKYQLEEALKQEHFAYNPDEYENEQAARDAAEERISELENYIHNAIDELAQITIDVDTKSPSWGKGARTMMQAILYAMLWYAETGSISREQFTLQNLAALAANGKDDCKEIISWLEGAEDVAIVKNALNAYWRITANVTRDSYQSTLRSPLAKMSTPIIHELTATEGSLDIEAIAKNDRPYAIFFTTNDQSASTNTVAMMMVNSLAQELVTYAKKQESKQHSRDFIFLLDEFAQMPPMPSLEAKISTWRSYRLWMMLALQSYQQLDHVYSENIRKIVLCNASTQYFLGSNDPETTQQFASSFGKRGVVEMSGHLQMDGGFSFNYSSVDVPVLRISELQHLYLGVCYVKTNSANIQSFFIPYFQRMDIEHTLYQPKGIFMKASPHPYHAADSLPNGDEEDDIWSPIANPFGNRNSPPMFWKNPEKKQTGNDDDNDDDDTTTDGDAEGDTDTDNDDIPQEEDDDDFDAFFERFMDELMEGKPVTEDKNASDPNKKVKRK